MNTQSIDRGRAIAAMTDEQLSDLIDANPAALDRLLAAVTDDEEDAERWDGMS